MDYRFIPDQWWLPYWAREAERKRLRNLKGGKVGEAEEADKYKIYRAVQQAGDPGRR